MWRKQISYKNTDVEKPKINYAEYKKTEQGSRTIYSVAQFIEEAVQLGEEDSRLQ